MRPQIRGLDSIEGAEAPKEERRRGPKSTLEMGDGSYILTGLRRRRRLCFLGDPIIPCGDAPAATKGASTPFVTLLLSHDLAAIESEGSKMVDLI
jgi:hypothetical protein